VCRACAAELRPPSPLPPPTGLADCTAWCRYDDVAADLLVSLKNRHRRDLVGWLAEAIAAGGPPGPDPHLVTWAPTAGARHRARGFDQAELLARALARRWSLPCRPLLRRRGGPAQSGASAAARRAHPGFTVVGRVPPEVVLVDDVVTTGATLAAAAGALRSAGAQAVHGVVIARAAGPGRA
jgi:predicted amidophosphoribosyltransferase